MTQPYSSDLRERVVRAHLAGEPVRQMGALRCQRLLGAEVGCASRRVSRESPSCSPVTGSIRAAGRF